MGVNFTGVDFDLILWIPSFLGRGVMLKGWCASIAPWPSSEWHKSLFEWVSFLVSGYSVIPPFAEACSVSTGVENHFRCILSSSVSVRILFIFGRKVSEFCGI